MLEQAEAYAHMQGAVRITSEVSLTARPFFERKGYRVDRDVYKRQALNRGIARGNVKSYPRHEMLDLVMIDGKARGIIARNLITGEIERFGADVYKRQAR